MSPDHTTSINPITGADRPTVFLALLFVPGAVLGLLTPLRYAFPAAASLLITGFALSGSSSRKVAISMTALMLAGCGIIAGIRGSECGPSDFHIGFAEKCCEVLKEIIEEIPFKESSTAALLKAFLTGDRSGLEPELLSIFRKSGASHLLALSGLHLGIIYLILSKLISIGGGADAIRKTGAATIILITLFYTVMTGASPSISRAFLFILIREGGVLIGRRSSLVRCWCIALTIQTSISPTSLLLPGFQLSYLAMLGICLLMPPLQSIFPAGKIKSPMKRIWDIASLSLSCQAFTAPLSLKLFGSFPQFFLITNLLAMPMMTVLMISAVLCVFLSALGLCPGIVTQFTEALCRLLIRILEIVCMM